MYGQHVPVHRAVVFDYHYSLRETWSRLCMYMQNNELVGRERYGLERPIYKKMEFMS